MNTKLMETKLFHGTLSKDENKIEVDFSVEVEKSGKLKISFEKILLDSKSQFICDYFYKGVARFEEFCLQGVASDETTFECENIIITNLGNENYLRSTLSPVAHYSFAKMSMPLNEESKPVLLWHIKGFRSFPTLFANTSLGEVSIGGKRDGDGRDEVSGFIRVAASEIPEKTRNWREKADALCSHIESIMSFALGTELKSPISEFHNGHQLDRDFYSQSPTQKSVYPVFSWLHLKDIFSCAIENYFNPSLSVNNLSYAIKWFNMRGAYREANLITAMTVLENLIDSNLSEEETYLMTEEQFEKLRKKLRAHVKEEVKIWTENKEDQKNLIKQINEKFGDLRRKSLIDKIYLLAEKWGVPLDDIDKEHIKKAKKARDHVVHCGQYKVSNDPKHDLHDHVLIVRELVVRFILTAIDFEGGYESYVGGQHMRQFKKTLPLASDQH